MPASQFITLNTGARMPTVGLGTWKSQPGEVEHAVEHALKAGYRHIDTATAYANEKEVGLGLKESGIPREEIFLTTKLNNSDQRNPEEALKYSLEQLDTPYLDLWLMHWPAPMKKGGGPDKEWDWLDTWKGMEDVYLNNPDKVKAIGISNFSVEYLERLLPETRVKPAMNQIELHPSCPQSDVRAFCLANDIALTAYSPLGSDNSPLLSNPTVKRIADAHGVHPANILVSFQANSPKTAVLVKSVKPARIEQNLKVVDLSAEEVEALGEIDKSHHFRACKPFWTGWGHLGWEDCKAMPEAKA